MENNLLTPASVGVLSEPAGMAKARYLWPRRLCAICSSASWAKVSKQAMYLWASLCSCGQRALTSCIDQISENQWRPSLVQSHPPMPTVSPSAMASAAERQLRRRGSDKGLVGVACTQERSQARQSLLSLVRLISEAEGSATLTHLSLSDLGRRGTSDLRRTLMLPTSMMREEVEM